MNTLLPSTESSELSSDNNDSPSISTPDEVESDDELWLPRPHRRAAAQVVPGASRPSADAFPRKTLGQKSLTTRLQCNSPTATGPGKASVWHRVLSEEKIEALWVAAGRAVQAQFSDATAAKPNLNLQQTGHQSSPATGKVRPPQRRRSQGEAAAPTIPQIDRSGDGRTADLAVEPLPTDADCARLTARQLCLLRQRLDGSQAQEQRHDRTHTLTWGPRAGAARHCAHQTTLNCEQVLDADAAQQKRQAFFAALDLVQVGPRCAGTSASSTSPPGQAKADIGFDRRNGMQHILEAIALYECDAANEREGNNFASGHDHLDMVAKCEAAANAFPASCHTSPEALAEDCVAREHAVSIACKASVGHVTASVGDGTADCQQMGRASGVVDSRLHSCKEELKLSCTANNVAAAVCCELGTSALHVREAVKAVSSTLHHAQECSSKAVQHVLQTEETKSCAALQDLGRTVTGPCGHHEAGAQAWVGMNGESPEDPLPAQAGGAAAEGWLTSGAMQSSEALASSVIRGHQCESTAWLRENSAAHGALADSKRVVGVDTGSEMRGRSPVDAYGVQLNRSSPSSPARSPLHAATNGLTRATMHPAHSATHTSVLAQREPRGGVRSNSGKCKDSKNVTGRTGTHNTFTSSGAVVHGSQSVVLLFWDSFPGPHFVSSL
jgi:hypothetical protein